MKCLYELSVEQLVELVEKDLYLTKWFIRDDKISNRTDSVQYTDRFLKIKKQAEKKGISYNDIEVVTWFDTLITLYQIFGRIEDDDI